MFVAIGWVVVLGAVIGSFIGGGGHVAALIQPFEFICIFGAALGAFVVSNPLKTIKAVIGAIPGCFQGPQYTKKKYLDVIALLYELLQKVRTQGMLALEADIADPTTSPIFTKYPAILKDHHLLEFIQDYMRMLLEGNIEPHQLDELMTAELDTHHTELMIPSAAVQTMADGMPAFGIVSAVMGVVHTMGSVGAPPAVLGQMVAEALVGTFLGILIGYGFIGPVASLMASKARDAAVPYESIKAILLANLNGCPPGVAVEFGRKVLFSTERPTFAELEEAVRATKDTPHLSSIGDSAPAPAMDAEPVAAPA